MAFLAGCLDRLVAYLDKVPLPAQVNQLSENHPNGSQSKPGMPSPDIGHVSNHKAGQGGSHIDPDVEDGKTFVPPLIALTVKSTHQR